ncbi:hypothetical protein CC80DRAFT_544019 [Byssothecium circinans]|uniref:Uncharacterized protein n=1 Tax=Byssothecium circinans TaxID=147558 RepID=A0A6A5U9E3_9PLEO|nr:hypothetical protein CC80DRAFT_544019 [Byssothecium circinans]
MPTSQQDSLDATKDRVLANARAIYGSGRSLDIVTFGSTSTLQITAAVIEHNPSGRSYIHCCSAAEDNRLAAIEHLLVITEDLLARLMEGISSSGWLPGTPQSQHAAAFGGTPQNLHAVAFGSTPNLLQYDQSRRGSTLQAESRRGSVIANGNMRDIVNGPGRIEGTIASSASSVIASPHPPAAAAGSGSSIAVPRPHRTTDRVQWIMGSES